jgi:hypothetical protein
MNGSLMNMFIYEPFSMNMFIHEQFSMNMFINEPFVVERRPTLSILERACQATSRAGKQQLHLKLE